MASSIPYYAYRLQLIVRKDSPIRKWDDLRRQGLKVGVLKDSAAHRYLERTYPDLRIDALDAEGTTEVMSRVERGLFDATVQDAPVVSWYMGSQAAVSRPVRPLRAGRSGAAQLLRDLLPARGREARLVVNEAIRAGLADGSLRRIYERYGVWNVDQQNLLETAQHWPPPRGGVEEGPRLVRGDGWRGRRSFTIRLACTAMPLAMMIGLLVALVRVYGPRWATVPCVVYVEVIRGTPVLLQLAVIYYFLPSVGIRLEAFWAGVFGLALNYGAYEAEELPRRACLAIPGRQMEAALSLGMSPYTALRRIIVPQGGAAGRAAGDQRLHLPCSRTRRSVPPSPSPN